MNVRFFVKAMLVLMILSISATFVASCSNDDTQTTPADIEQERECYTNEDCPIGTCCDANGTCGTCGIPSDGDSPDNFDGVCISDSDCDDGVFCNGAERCVSGQCVQGTPPNCDDGIDCTADSCDEEQKSCIHTPDNSVCSDGNACNGEEICDPTSGCVDGTPLECNDGFDCTTDSCDPESGCVYETDDSMCDDGIECTNDVCKVGSGCVNEPIDSACDDSIDCTEDICDATLGCRHVPKHSLCDDGKACTEDACNPETGCTNVPNDAQCPMDKICRPNDSSADENGCIDRPACMSDEECDDGQYCNGVEKCVNNVCVNGQAVKCDDGISCTIDVCNEETDSCDFQPQDSFCDDGNVCNGAETCQPENPAHNENGCVAGEALVCNDGIDCTSDSCDPVNGCVFEPNHGMCDDGVDCTVDTCSIEARGCVHEPKDSACDDGIDCTIDFCNRTSGCTHTVDDSACNDGFACTDEHCDETRGCIYTTHNDRCDDGIACTENTCVRGRGCVYNPDDSMCPPDEICDTSEGCRVPPECETDEDCSDGNLCNGIEKCVDGFCQNGEPPVCDDGIDCTVDSCNPQTGCVYEPDDSACVDNDVCTSDICDPQQGCRNPVDKDSDNDGYIDKNCPGGDDCNDNNDAIHPGQQEVCSDGLDNNCDGLTDEEDEAVCGNCGGSCPDGQYCCHNVCVDLNTDDNNCGACDNACGAGMRCWDRVCRPASHPCFAAIDNLITSDFSQQFSYSGHNDNFNPNGSSSCDIDLDGPDLVWAFKKNANEPVTVYLYPPGSDDITDEYLYVVSDCFDMNSCIAYKKSLNWNQVTLPAGAPEHIYFAIADWDYPPMPDGYNREIKIKYNDDGGCRDTTEFTATASFVLLVLLSIRSLRRRRKAATWE